MNPTNDDLESAVLSLPVERRASLARILLDSLDERDEVSPSEITAAWVAECERRLAAYDRGEMKAIPAEEVFRELRSKKSQ